MGTTHYDDPEYFYEKYWQTRDYEQGSEMLALNRLLESRRFVQSADIGGGYGRLSAFLSQRSRHVTLVEPSGKQRLLAKKYLPPKASVTISSGSAQKTGLPSASQDLVIMIRVMHHLPDPRPALVELSRILKPGGLLVLEFANSFHFKARVKSLFSGQPILLAPVERRSLFNIRRRTIPFVNHHPHTIVKLLRQSGFSVSDILSVSNYRSPFLKQVLPTGLLLKLESYSQRPFSKIYFGPSIFILARKI